MRSALALAAALLAGNASAASDIDAFFAAMAIEARPGQQSRYVMGDNVAGYFEGYTHSHGKGQGYTIRNSQVLADIAAYRNGAMADRARAREQVLPYGHRVVHTGGLVEETALLSRQQALTIRLASPAQAQLGIQFTLKEPGAVTRDRDVVLVASGAYTMALAASVPFTVDSKLMLQASARNISVVAAFDTDPQKAARRARQLAAGDPIADERRAMHAALTRSSLVTSDARYNRALNWAKSASNLFVVEEFGTGIWAGLPWFRDNWGRDTFIALPGTLLVSGDFERAKAVLANFARYQNLRAPRDKEYGRVPNRVAAGDSIIYNTVDGTPWMLREALEYIRYTGDQDFAREMYRLALPYFEGALANYTDADGLLTHDSADTWMDARIENRQPWSARGPRAVEIQALWYTALQTGAWLAAQAGDEPRAKEWAALAHKARLAFLRLYWDGKVMADRLREDASRDTRVRPNQLMLVSIPFDDFVPPAVQAQVTRNAASELLYPYGIASLSQNDPYFHPRHENPDFHHKDAAYHQGTVWGWNAGFTVTALNKFGYQDHAWKLTRNLGEQILGLGTLGNMSELLDALPAADGSLTPSGTYAQSWSVAEYARNGYQDYVGFRPNLPANTLDFVPAIPAAWRYFDAVLPFGRGERLDVKFTRSGASQRWRLRLYATATRKVSFSMLGADKSRSQLAFDLAPGRAATLILERGKASIDGKTLALVPALPSFAGTIGTLRFQTPKAYRPADFPMLQSKDVLKGIVERNEYR